MEIKREYQVVQASNIDHLEQQVNALLAEEWKLQGGVTCTGDLWTQAMFREDVVYAAVDVQILNSREFDRVVKTIIPGWGENGED